MAAITMTKPVARKPVSTVRNSPPVQTVNPVLAQIAALQAQLAQLQAAAGVPMAQTVPTGMVPVSPEAMEPHQLRELLARKYGFRFPLSWTHEQMINAYRGKPGAYPTNGFKAELAQACHRIRKFLPGKSWTCKDIWEAMHGRKNPRGKAVKDRATADYMKMHGEAPPKSWSATRIAVSLETGVKGKPGTSRPGVRGQRPVKRTDGMTADKCKELLRAHRAAGHTVEAYSKLNADGLRELCAEYGLTA